MKLSKIKVEQIKNNKEIILDYGEILSPSELRLITNKAFHNSIIKDNLIFGDYKNKKYCIFVKNISYLGNPHPLHKKRIQIPKKFKETHFINDAMGIKTLLIGIYKYKNTLLFCDFDTEKYVKNKINNSSAHVHTIDLYNGNKYGYFSKKDTKDNVITVFNESSLNIFLEKKLFNSDGEKIEEFKTLDDFFLNVTKEWFGIDAYMEMITNGYENKFQPEWPGFYFEYKLEEYINKKEKHDLIQFCKNKKRGGIDLDILFPRMGFYGDLKTHSIGVSGIQGNDFSTIMNLLEKQSVYYIIVNHETKKDKDHGYKVTKFWNEQLRKKDLMSYSNRMKHSIKIKSYYILELNKFNKKYIDLYNQGKNSDGKPRSPKIIISTKNINNFLVHRVDFV